MSSLDLNNWSGKKMANILLSKAYESVDMCKAQRLKECASWLEFKVLEDGQRKLSKANFCRVRLCPVCSWRRALKVFSQMCSIMSYLQRNNELDKYFCLFLTLTVKNCSGQDLCNNLDKLNYGWKLFSKSKLFSSTVVGWYKGLEVTHNININSKDYGTFHPHFHCILVVKKSYFKKHYVSHKKWQSLWAKCMSLDYNPQVNIKSFRSNIVKGLKEVTKYSVKSSDYIIPDDWDLTVDTVKILDKTLDKRRFVSFGGLLKDIHRQLRLDDEESGNLINLRDNLEQVQIIDIIRYCFCTGYNQYIATK